MKKFVSLLVVLAMLMAIAPAVFAEDAPVGDVTNPAELVLGENVAEVAANPEQLGEKGYYFAWTATGDGVLTIDFSDEDANTPFVMFYVFDAEGAFANYAEIMEQGGMVEIPVSAGYLVQFGVEEYNYAAATFHFTATFEAAVVQNGSGTETDPWIIDALPTTLEGTFTEEDVANEDFMGYYYQFTATEAGTVDWSVFSNCGLFVTVNGEWHDADAVTVAANDVVLINVWALFASDYSVTVSFEAGAAEGGNEGGEEGGEDVDGLILGDNAFEIPEASNDGDIFVATEDGTLVITVTEMLVYDAETDEYVSVAPNMHLGRTGNYQLVVDEVDVGSHVYTVEVVAGQEVAIYITTQFGAAAKATVNLSMETAEEEENETPPTGSVELEANEFITYEITPDADGVLTVILNSSTGYEVIIRDNIGDLDSANWGYDPGEEIWIEENVVAGVTYTVTITGHNGEWDYIAAAIDYIIEFTPAGEEGGEEVPSCTHDGTIYLEQDFCYGDEVTYDLVETCWECGATFERYLPGTEKNPILVDFLWNDEYTEATATVTVPAGETIVFGQYRIGGLLLTINGVEYGVIEDMGWYDPSVFAITNDGAEEATYELVLSYPEGSYDNPYVLNELGSFVLELAENNNGVYYQWIATEDGLLTLTVEGNNWFYVVNNVTSGKYGDTCYAKVGDSNTYSVVVAAGDQILIGFGTQDPDFNSPAETLNITLELGEVPEVEAIPVVIGDNAVADGKYEFTATQAGTLYFRVTALAYKYGDISDMIRDYLGSDVLLYVNGELVADGYFGFLEVAEGDVVTFEWVSNSYYVFDGTLSLSYENNNPVLGSEERPVYLEYTDCPTTTIEIAPGTTVWYELSYEFYDAVLTIKGENVFVQYSYYSYEVWDMVTETINAENGVITLSPIPSMTLQIGNAGTEAATFEIDAYIPEGTSGNPADLELGENVVDLEAERPDYFYYDWTAPADGTLTITVGGDFWHFYVMNITTYEQSDWLFYYGDYETGEIIDTVVMQVAAGDQLIVAVSTCINSNDIDWEDPNLVYPIPLPAGTITTVASFVCDEHGETYTDFDYCYENEMLYDLVERCIHCDAEIARYVPGTEFNPILVDFLWNETWTEATATVTVPVGTTYFAAYNVGGMLLTITDSEGNVIGTQLLPEVWGRMPVTFALTNEGEAEVTYSLSVVYPEGHMMNPADLAEGETVLDLAEGNTGYYYEWVAEKNGVLTVMVSGDNWMFFVNNLTAAIYSDYMYSDADPVVSQYSIEVKAGDVVQVYATTFDPNFGPNPAGQITVNLIFEADSPDTGDASVFMALAAVLVSGMSIIALPKKKEN